MVSDFIHDVSGYVHDNQAQARLHLETHTQGYFTNDYVLEQVVKTIDIFECIHPGVFIFDNAPSHCKVSGDAVNADRMNVG